MKSSLAIKVTILNVPIFESVILLLEVYVTEILEKSTNIVPHFYFIITNNENRVLLII